MVSKHNKVCFQRATGCWLESHACVKVRVKVAPTHRFELKEKLQSLQAAEGLAALMSTRHRSSAQISPARLCGHFGNWNRASIYLGTELSQNTRANNF